MKGAGYPLQHIVLDANPRRPAHHLLGELPEDRDISDGVGLRYIASADRGPYSHPVGLVGMRTQGGFNIPEATATGKLCPYHHQQMIPTRVVLDIRVAVILLHETIKIVLGKERHELIENVRCLSHLVTF